MAKVAIFLSIKSMDLRQRFFHLLQMEFLVTYTCNSKEETHLIHVVIRNFWIPFYFTCSFYSMSLINDPLAGNLFSISETSYLNEAD